jgi:hypothetical protein
VVAVRVTYLPRVLVRRRPALGVPLDLGDVLDPQLLGQVLDDRPRHVEGVLKEQPDVPHRALLESEAETVVVPAPLRDQLQVLVIEEEEALQLGPRRLLGELAVRLSLLISQKFHRHAADRSHPPPVIEDLPPNPRTGPITCARCPRSSA